MISTKEITPQSAIDVNSLFLLGAFGKTIAPFYFWGYAFTGKGVRGWVGSLKGDLY
jgi:hypothetical protein